MPRLLILIVFVSLLTACAPVTTFSPDSVVEAPTGEEPGSGYTVEKPLDETPTTVEPFQIGKSASETEMPMSENQFSPKPGDGALDRGNLYIETADLLTMESFPLQFALQLTGNLPTPCNQLRLKVSPPDADKRIDIEAYTVIDPGMMCTQVLKPFEANLPLGSFPAGHYTLWLNGEKISEFDA